MKIEWSTANINSFWVPYERKKGHFLVISDFVVDLGHGATL